MKMRIVMLVAASLAASCNGPAGPTPTQADITDESSAGDGCPYRPSFVTLRHRTRDMAPTAALAALNAYAADPANENPEACQSMALDAAIGEREQALVTLRLADGRSIPAHTSHRCEIVDPVTTACRGAGEDGTAHPFSLGILRGGTGQVVLTKPTTATIAGALPGAKLEAVYRLRVADLLDGGRATKLPTVAPIALAPDQALAAVVAIFSTRQGRRHHKLVWYYGLLNLPPAAAT